MGLLVSKALLIIERRFLFVKIRILKQKTMRYLVCDNSENKPYYTEEISPSKFSQETDMIIFDLVLGKYTIDGKHWEDIEEDTY